MWASGGTASALATTYAPLLVAVAGLITAVVTYLSRRDYRARTVTEGMDARTNTAIKGLSEAYDRVEAERARLEEERDAWQARALTAEAELAALRQRPGSATKRRRSPPVD